MDKIDSTEGFAQTRACDEPMTVERELTSAETLSDLPSPLFSNIALHACCGPCSIDVVRDLRARGIEPHLYYANSNIAPAAEYAHRLQTIKEWASAENVDFVEGDYDPADWQARVDAVWRAGGDIPREERCRVCYRQRFEAAAEWARDAGFDALGTTLTISPYQFTGIIKEELARACEKVGIKSAFEDYSGLYPASRIDAREAGMYMQNYCGCAYSDAEARAERAAAKIVREKKRAEKAAANAAAAAEVKAKKEEMQAYREKRARQKELLRRFKSESSESGAVSRVL